MMRRTSRGSPSSRSTDVTGKRTSTRFAERLLRERFRGGEDFVGVDRGVDLWPDLRDFSVGADEERDALAHAERALHAVALRDRAVFVRGEWERQVVILHELAVALLGVARDADEGDVLVLE